MKRPSFQFYPSDWLTDMALRSCSIQARGLWIDMICIMHQGSPYGHLKVNDKVVSDQQLARIVGANLDEVKSWLEELSDAAVFSTTDDGVIFSRRMVSDEGFRAARAAGGKAGGNPKLISQYNKPGFVYAMLRHGDGCVKIGISQDPAKRLYKIRAQYPGDKIEVIGKKYVEDMGATEAEIHATFSHCKDGEWFALTQDEREHLLKNLLNFPLKAKVKGIATPSSSSSSSSPKDIDRPKRKSQLTDDEITSEWMVKAQSYGMADKTAENELGKFKNHYLEKKAVSENWLRQWDTWCRNWVSYGSKQVGVTNIAQAPTRVRHYVN